MSTTAHRAAAALTVAVAALGFATTASAGPPPPAGLQVEGGDGWRSKRSFRLVWGNPAHIAGTPIVAVHYRVRDPAGGVATGATRIGWAASSLEGLEVPGPAGAYTAEVWFEDGAGGQGAPAAAKLRFDDARPGPVEPVVVASWVGRTAFPLRIRLSHPTGELPVSGLRGYAIAVSPVPGRSPCAAIDRCDDAETDLRGGAGDDTYLVSELTEGVHHVEAVAVSGSGMASPTPGKTVLRVDKTSPVTSLFGLPGGWTNRPVTLTAAATDLGSGMAPGAGPLPHTAIAIDGGPPAIAAGATVAATVIGEGVHRVTHYARDLAGNANDGGTVNGTRNPEPAAAAVRIDRTPPGVSFLDSQDPADPELVRVRVGDSLSGPDTSRGWIGIRRTGSGDSYAPLTAVPPGARELRARWDSDSFAPGEYELRAVGYDAAGNVTATGRRGDGAAMVLANPLKTTATVRIGIGGSAARGMRTVPFGRGVLLRGRLVTGGGAPPGRTPLRIVERFSERSGLSARTSTVASAPGGAFSIRLSPGPSREVTAVFDGTPTLSRATSQPLQLGVRSAVRLRASSAVARVGGAPLVFRGEVGAAVGTIPPDGVSVELQFRLAGQSWSEFRTIQTDRRGRFRYAYRFSDDDSRGARFQFRAYVPAQSGWPYEPGGSRPVAVRGR